MHYKSEDQLYTIGNRLYHFMAQEVQKAEISRTEFFSMQTIALLEKKVSKSIQPA